jgi:hypothetical protein
MLWVPEASVVVVNFAVPALKATVFSVVVPSRNVTEPATVPPNCPAIVAVKVREAPAGDGFSDDPRVVMVLAWLTSWFSAADVLIWNEALPA